MLVLSRKVGEKIVIDGNISVVVNHVSGNRVSLGIQAPKQVRIVRGEIADQEAPVEEEEPALCSASGSRPITFEFAPSPVFHRAR